MERNERPSAATVDTCVLESSHRSSVIGNDQGAMFSIGFGGDTKSRPLPKRLQKYQAKQKTTTEAELLNKQKLAEERKKKYNEHKAMEARKVSEQVIKFDQQMRAQLQAADNQQKWYDGKLPK